LKFLTFFSIFFSHSDEKLSLFDSSQAAMAQLNAGDVLAIVGGDVTRKPVLQCIGEMREARREK